MSTIEDRAREFINGHIKNLPLPVQLNGITEAEKQGAADLCVDFAKSEFPREREEAAEIAVRGFIGKVEENMRAIGTPTGIRNPIVLQRTVFGIMFGKEL